MLKIYSSEELPIQHNLIDSNALDIITKLHQNGFTAYLVGGSVRDLIAQKTPKDFDISTSALPEQVKKIFRNTLLIGRRFRLAHVRFGNKIFEVSTFRSGSIDDSDLIIRDNTWGSPEEDALRRDFTINGLFYDPITRSIIDYVGGCDDIKNNLLKTIGNPTIRFKQDPVRMIRLLKFYSRLGFDIDSPTEQALIGCRSEITKSAPARIMEEMLRMLESGYAEKFFTNALQCGLLEHIFPWCHYFLKRSQTGLHYLKTLDLFVNSFHNQRQHVILRPALFACLLFPILEEEINHKFISNDIIPRPGDIADLTSDLIKAITLSSAALLPRRMQAVLFHLLTTQYRLTPLDNKISRSERPARNKEFRYALQFLHIRSKLDDKLDPTYQRWSKIYFTHHPQLKSKSKKKRYNSSSQRRQQ